MTDEAKRLVEHLRNGEISQAMAFDASCLIVYLDAALEHTKREMDAAVEDLWGVCRACIHYNDGEIICCCKFEECTHGADDWDSEDHWQWRGVRKEENND